MASSSLLQLPRRPASEEAIRATLYFLWCHGCPRHLLQTPRCGQRYHPATQAPRSTSHTRPIGALRSAGCKSRRSESSSLAHSHPSFFRGKNTMMPRPNRGRLYPPQHGADFGAAKPLLWLHQSCHGLAG